MTPEELKELRKGLQCTAKELAGALAVEQSTVMAWEKGELFPTKANVDKMNALRAKGPSSIPKKSKTASDPMKTMTDPSFWALVRKLAAHKKLRDDATKLAEPYADPAGE